MELSIIVPVYNCAGYIERTVDRLLTQSVADYEIILVDDGSTDGSAALCDNLAARHAAVKCLHIENGGPGNARNRGIEQATGRYIAFCDADDLPAVDMYGILLNDLKEHGVEYSICDIFSERDNRAFGFPWKGNVRFEGTEIFDCLLASMLGNMSDNDNTQPVWGSSVRCIYVKSIITENNISFPTDIHFAEDLVFNVRYIRHIKSCFIRNEALYRYTCNPASLMNSHIKYNSTAFWQRLELVRLITDELRCIVNHPHLAMRFMTSRRCYFLEMAGNAARAITTHGRAHALNEMKQIVNHPVVKESFEHFDASTLKKQLSYTLIQKRCARILLAYFAVRLR